MAVGRAPEAGAPLASQSTISRFENAPSRTDAARLAVALVDQLTTRVRPSHRAIFDIDDTFDAAHEGQQLTFWNAHDDEPGSAPSAPAAGSPRPGANNASMIERASTITVRPGNSCCWFASRIHVTGVSRSQQQKRSCGDYHD